MEINKIFLYENKTNTRVQLFLLLNINRPECIGRYTEVYVVYILDFLNENRIIPVPLSLFDLGCNFCFERITPVLL